MATLAHERAESHATPSVSLRSLDGNEEGIAGACTSRLHAEPIEIGQELPFETRANALPGVLMTLLFGVVLRDQPSPPPPPQPPPPTEKVAVWSGDVTSVTR